MTGDCQARICGGTGLRCPGLPDLIECIRPSCRPGQRRIRRRSGFRESLTGRLADLRKPRGFRQRLASLVSVAVGRVAAGQAGRMTRMRPASKPGRSGCGPGLVMAMEISIRLERVGSRPIERPRTAASIAGVGAVVRSGLARCSPLASARLGEPGGRHALSTHEARTKGPRSPGQFRHGAAHESRCDLRSGAIANMPG